MSIRPKSWFAFVGLAVFLTPFSALASSIDLTAYSATMTPAVSGDALGYGSVFTLSGSTLANVSHASTTVSGQTAFDIGSFTEAPPNRNVANTTSFSLAVSISLTQGSNTPVTESFSFSGSLVKVGNQYEMTYTEPANSTNIYDPYTYTNYPSTGSNQGFETETLSFGTLGYYTFGIANDLVVDTGWHQTTTLYSFLAPAAAPPKVPVAVPEPLSAGLTGFAILGLIGFALRQKFRSK